MTNAIELLTAFAEPTRRTIVERLVTQPASATELARDLPITRSAVSQHLQVLKSAGLVQDRPLGTRRVYHVDPDALAIIRSYFDAHWQRSLAAFAGSAQDNPSVQEDKR